MKFTVIMTIYRRDTLVVRALYSVLRQTYGDWEVIMLADGPHPRIRSALETLWRRWGGTREKMSYWECRPPRGTFGNPLRREGVRRASGDYVCFLGHDCLLDAHFLETHRIALQGGPAVSVAQVAYWSQREGAQHPAAPPAEGVVDSFIGILPVGDPQQATMGHIDLLNYVLPRPLAAQHAFRPEWDTNYSADYLTFDACRREARLVYTPKIVAAHF